MVKVSNFMYGMILTIGIFAVLFGFASKMANNYGVTVPGKYNQTFAVLSNMTPIDDTTETLKETTLTEDTNQTASFFGRIQERFDISGLFFIRGLKALKVFPNTINIFSNMVDALLDNEVNLFGTATVSLRFIVVSMVIVAIMSLIIAAIVKWWI